MCLISPLMDASRRYEHSSRLEARFPGEYEEYGDGLEGSPCYLVGMSGFEAIPAVVVVVV